MAWPQEALASVVLVPATIGLASLLRGQYDMVGDGDTPRSCRRLPVRWASPWRGRFGGHARGTVGQGRGEPNRTRSANAAGRPEGDGTGR